jgi:hypothetical protein
MRSGWYIVLTPNEEARLESLREVIGTEQFEAEGWEIAEVKWLVTRLLEINEEASKYFKELDKANQELVRRAEFD